MSSKSVMEGIADSSRTSKENLASKAIESRYVYAPDTAPLEYE
jgi:hypothetical protein